MENRTTHSYARGICKTITLDLSIDLDHYNFILWLGEQEEKQIPGQEENIYLENAPFDAYVALAHKEKGFFKYYKGNKGTVIYLTELGAKLFIKYKKEAEPK